MGQPEAVHQRPDPRRATVRPVLRLGFDTFPPGDEVEWAELDIDDDYARDLLITFGPGGRVSDIRLKSCEGSEELRFALWRRLP